MEENALTTICEEIQQIMIERRKTLSSAESCTGGRISSAITAVAGSSAYFQGALVAYQNEVKIKMLHVKSETIDRFDVVSQEVVGEMVQGTCALFGSDYAIATSGYAGPGGGSDKVAQGTIWIAYGRPDRISTLQINEDKGRIANVENATFVALKAFLMYLKNDKT